MYDFLNQIPDGWRFYTCDWSRSDKCSIMLIRAGSGYTNWFKLSDVEQEAVRLYAGGSGVDFRSAFEAAVEKATPPINDYAI